MVRFLIEEAGVKMECDRFGLTPINDAVHNEHVEVRRYLQSKRLERHRSVVGSRSLRARSDSCDSTVALDLAAQNEVGGGGAPNLGPYLLRTPPELMCEGRSW